MIDHDRLFKELLTTFFVEFLELFLPEVAAYLERDSVNFLDKEVFTDVTAGEQYEADAEIATIELSKREVVMQIVTSWMREGIEQGLQQGRQEGELAIILRLLKRRIGTIDSTVEEGIRQLSLSQLEDLAEVLLDFSTEADLVALLQSISEESS